MITLAAPPSSRNGQWERKHLRSFVIIYEDFTAIERADRFCEKVIREFDLNTGCRKEAWSFQLLKQFPNIARITAAETAAEADFVILSLDGMEELPAHVKAWVEIWVENAGPQKPTLIALFNNTARDEQGTLRSTQAYLHRITNGLKE